MITIEAFKELLPSNLNLSRDEIVIMFELIDVQAGIILDAFITKKQDEIL